MDIGASEAETFWIAFLRKLARRGLRGVKLVVSDAHEGIKAAVSKVLSATWQRCRVHFMRNALGPCRAEADGASSRPSSPPPSPRTTPRPPRRNGAASPTSSGPRSPKLAALMDEAEADVLAYMTFPAAAPGQAALDQPARAPQRRDQAPHRRRRHLPERSRHHPARRRDPARAERRVGRPARPLHDPGKHRANRAMIRSSACPPWQPDRPGHAGDRRGPAQLHHARDTTVEFADAIPRTREGRFRARSVRRSGLRNSRGRQSNRKKQGDQCSRETAQKPKSHGASRWLSTSVGNSQGKSAPVGAHRARIFARTPASVQGPQHSRKWTVRPAGLSSELATQELPPAQRPRTPSHDHERAEPGSSQRDAV